MTRTTIAMTDSLYQYYLDNSLRENPLLAELRTETAKLSTSKMQIAPEEGQLLALIVELIGAKKTLDIGVYTGYSSTVVAMSLPKEGKVIACDINGEWTKMAQKYWQLAGINDKIDFRLGPALQTLDQLIVEGESDSFDFIFIDADKKNYPAYYERGLRLLAPGGVMAIDNVLWGGKVADDSIVDEDTMTIRQLNKKIHQDANVTLSMVPIADGLTLVRKK